MQAATTFFVTKYTQNVEALAQQMQARLWDYSTIRGEAPGSGAVAVEQFGSVNMQPVTGRLQPVSFTDTPADRRWVFPSEFYIADAVDSFEKLEMAIDPDGWITRMHTFAGLRQKDDTFISAFFGNALTGNTSTTSNAPSTTVAFPAAQQINVNTGSSGYTGNGTGGTGGTATGLNVPKLRAAKRVLLAGEVDLEYEDAAVGLSAQQIDNMLNQAQAISLDFNDKPVLVDGKITRFMGMPFKHSERLPLNASSQRRNPVWVKSGMHGAVWQDMTTDIRQRPDLVNNPWQCSLAMMIGATRVQEIKCVEIPNTEP